MVHLSERNGRHCVVEPSGKVKKCYDDRNEAIAYLRAINAHSHDSKVKEAMATVRGMLESKIHRSFTLAADDLYGLGYLTREQRIGLSSLISDVLEKFGESIDTEFADSPIDAMDVHALMKEVGEDAMLQVMDSGDTEMSQTQTISTDSNSTWVTVPYNGTKMLVLDDDEEEVEEKGVYYGPPPMSFADLEKEREAYEQQKEATELLGDFMSLAGNVVTYEEDKKSGLKRLAQEFLTKIGIMSDDEEEDDEDMMKDVPVEYKEKWTTAYINELPDSAFFLVESGGEKDSSGKTTPRSLRHLPYKDKNGKVDLPHVRNAIQRANQVKLSDGSKISESTANGIKQRAQKLLSSSTKDSFMIWKDADGYWRWFGIYSNKFRDDDYPQGEIIAEKAHQKFIGRVKGGDLAYPDLYVWHIPVPVGKADLLAYDNNGFSVVSGTFKSERVALALSKTEEDLAMSHGMPTEYIVRDETDPTVIIDYVSTEVSVLPRYAAANKMTDFRILSKEEKGMTFPVEQREEVVKLLGEDATLEIETALAEKASDASIAGIESKEKGEPQPEEKSTELETGEALADAGEMPAEVSEEPVAEEPVVEEPVVEEEPVVAEEPSEVDTEPVGGEDLKKELVTVLANFTKGLDDNLAKVTDRLDTLEQKLAELEKGDDERIAEKAASMPTASLAAMLAKAVNGDSQAESVIGNQATHVHGNSNLAKEKPQETGGEDEQAGLFFQSWTGR